MYKRQVLCVANLSEHPQSASIDLGVDRAGQGLRDLFAGGAFPWIDAEGKAQLTLGPRGYFWLAIDSSESA